VRRFAAHGCHGLLLRALWTINVLVTSCTIITTTAITPGLLLRGPPVDHHYRCDDYSLQTCSLYGCILDRERYNMTRLLT